LLRKKEEGRKEGRVGFCLEFGLKNISWAEGRKEGRGGFCLECGVGKEGRRGVLSRIWC